VEFARELTSFCSEIVEIINFDELTVDQAKAKLMSIAESEAPVEGSDMSFKKSCVFFGTPGAFSKMAPQIGGLVHYHSVVLEKIDLL
jgi:hypothetical protein